MLVSISDAKKRTGLTRYMIETHGPQPVRIGGRIFWRSADLDAWITEADHCSDNENKPRSEADILGAINGLNANEIR